MMKSGSGGSQTTNLDGHWASDCCVSTNRPICASQSNAMSSFMVPSSPDWQLSLSGDKTKTPSVMNNTAYLRPRVVFSKGPCPLTMPAIIPSSLQMDYQDTGHMERYSRKVFIGGLPPDIYEEEIYAAFNRFGPLTVSWPQKGETRPQFPPRGYAFLIFHNEESVQLLIDACTQKPAEVAHMSDVSHMAQLPGVAQRQQLPQLPVLVQLPVLSQQPQLYISVSSYLQPNKQVQIRPWSLADAEYTLNNSVPFNPRMTVFVGGVPRPFKAIELAWLMNELFGGVCCAGIDTDPELKYPKGAARVTFVSKESYLKAIKVRFVEVQMPDQRKRMEVKPFVLDDQRCDHCLDKKKCAPYFCANLICLKYFCEFCWSQCHTDDKKQFHKPVVKEWADRPRTLPYRRC